MVSTVTTNGFSLFVLSVDGMLGRESLILLYQFSQAMAKKREQPLSQVWGWVNGHIAIIVVRSCSRMISRVQLPIPLQEREPGWDLELGILLSD